VCVVFKVDESEEANEGERGTAEDGGDEFE